jgi:vacuolar-type H+-ATPase subunit H
LERVINHLFDIEKKANQIIERANAEKTELLEDNEKAIAKMEAEIADETNMKIKVMNDQAENEIEKEKQLLIDKSNKQLTDLETNYTKNHDDLVDKVFKTIILF